jgi:hypothetical protein
MRILVALAVAMLLAEPAWAQRDTMRMGETLGTVVVRPQRPEGQREDLRPQESLEKVKQQAEPAPPQPRPGGGNQ